MKGGGLERQRQGKGAGGAGRMKGAEGSTGSIDYASWLLALPLLLLDSAEAEGSKHEQLLLVGHLRSQGVL